MQVLLCMCCVEASDTSSFYDAGRNYTFFSYTFGRGSENFVHFEHNCK